MKLQEPNSDRNPSSINRSHSLRPKSALLGVNRNTDRRIHRSYGKFNQEELTFRDESKIQMIWDAFGKYVARNIKQGRGVAVPKFGQFTFTSVYVDLKGSTNTYIRDSQERFPVFLIGKDFNCHLPIQAGIASGMTTEMFGPDGQHSNQTNHLRIYGNQGQSGIIPKVKLNYFEVALLTDGAANKDECKVVIDQKIRTYSEIARRGQNIDDEVPNLGRFQIKNGIAGFIFNKNIFHESRCKTAKKYNNIFGRNNWMNDRLYEADKTNFGENAQPVDVFSTSSIKLTRNASNWLRNNLGMQSFEAVSPNAQHRTEDNNNYQLKTDSAKVKRQRPQTATTGSRVSSVKTISRYSQASTFLSRVPDLAPFELMNMANSINLVRASLITMLQSSKSDKTMREVLTSSQIQRILTKVNVKIPVGHLKALLKELGFEWNGKSCSVLSLLQQVKEYINPQRQYTQNFDNQTNKCSRLQKLIPPEQEAIIDVKKKDGDFTIIEIVKDLFYSSGLTMFQLFRQACQSATMSYAQFKQLVETYSGNLISETDIQNMFGLVSRGKDQLSFKDFEENFQHNIPSTHNLQSETLIIKKIREWMFQKQYSTKTAFDRLVRCVDRFGINTLRRVDLHKAFIVNRVGLTAPEIDFLCDLLLDNSAGEISFEHWSSKIYDDVVNPLQLIREVVHSQNINEDDLLFQMKIKIWDDPLYYKQFENCLLRIDPSFSDGQCKALFDKLKNQEERVEIPLLVNNICGSQKDTVDYKNSMMKQLYQDIFQNGKQEELQALLEQGDLKNDGKIHPKELSKVILKLTEGKYSEEDMQKFVRQLRKDENYKIPYNELMERVTIMGNKDHNPFKTLMQRMAFFLEQNKISVSNLLKRLSSDGDQISVERFGEFLKQKIDKRRPQQELMTYAHYIDIDKDGVISEEDLLTCLRNLNSTCFFQDSGSTLGSSTFNASSKYFKRESRSQKLSEDKILQICDQIKQGLLDKKMSIKALWGKIDTNHAGMINLNQFSQGISDLVKLATPIVEKFFGLMDTNRIGLVDYEKFQQVLSIETSISIPNSEKQLSDGFEWQESVIRRIREWCTANKLGPVEAFRSFDRDLSGAISKDNMKKCLIEFLQIEASECTNNRMDRLFKMMSFYKQNVIQQSDFDRLLLDQNPYLASGTASTKTKFLSSVGGGFSHTSTQDWKFSALQQIGLVISKRFPTLEACFTSIAGDKQKIYFQDFQKFVDETHALNGFNITMQLLQKLFAELDPHRKAYLSLNDWKSGFKLFNQQETMMIEFKNFIQSNFVNVESAYAFLLQHGSSGPNIDLATFKKAMISIIGSKRATDLDTKNIFAQLAGDKDHFSKAELEREFSDLKFLGTQFLQLKQSSSERAMNIQNNKIKTLKTHNTQTSQWEANIIDKIKLLIKQSGKPLDDVFRAIDSNKNGLISKQEFIDAISSLGIALTSHDIVKLMKRLDSNQDGLISYNEFVAKMRDDQQYDQRLKQRANNKLAQIKQQIVQHMTSTTKAFQMFDSTKTETLSYTDFDRLLQELARLSGNEVPSYLVVRDVFDAIDQKKDQLIDLQEWNDTFNKLESSDPKLALKTTPLALYHNSFEAKQILQCMHRNRKLLIERFKKYSTHSDHNGEARYITFEQAKKALEPLIISNFKQMISNAKLDCLLSVAQVATKIGSYPEIKLYDFSQLV